MVAHYLLQLVPMFGRFGAIFAQPVPLNRMDAHGVQIKAPHWGARERKNRIARRNPFLGNSRADVAAAGNQSTNHVQTLLVKPARPLQFCRIFGLARLEYEFS